MAKNNFKNKAVALLSRCKAKTKSNEKEKTALNRKFSVTPISQRRMADIIFDKICRLLAGNEFDIIINTQVDPFAGFVDYDKNKIYLNPNQYTLIETLIHELLHILKPKADEQTIIEMTGLIFDTLDEKQKGMLWSYIDALTTRCVGICKKDLVPA